MYLFVTLLIIPFQVSAQDSLKMVSEIRLDLEKFAIQRESGKIIQLVATLGVGITGYLISDGKDVPTAVPIILSGVALVGFIIDMDAGNRLVRKKQRKVKNRN